MKIAFQPCACVDVFWAHRLNNGAESEDYSSAAISKPCPEKGLNLPEPILLVDREMKPVFFVCS